MKPTNRREFLGRTAAALAASGAPLIAKDKKKIAAAPKRRILGANDRINVAFIGTGMRFTGLAGHDFIPRRERQNDVEFVGVCDVWEPRLKHAQEIVSWEKRMAVEQPWLQAATDSRSESFEA